MVINNFNLLINIYIYKLLKCNLYKYIFLNEKKNKTHIFILYGDAHSKRWGSAKNFFLRFYFNYILIYLIFQEKKNLFIIY